MRNRKKHNEYLSSDPIITNEELRALKKFYFIINQ